MYGVPPPVSIWRRERIYDVVFPEPAGAERTAAQILASLDLERTNKRTRDRHTLINRMDLIIPRRITYQPSDRKPILEVDAVGCPRVPGSDVVGDDGRWAYSPPPSPCSHFTRRLYLYLCLIPTPWFPMYRV